MLLFLPDMLGASTILPREQDPEQAAVLKFTADSSKSVVSEPTVGSDASLVLRSAGQVITSPSHWRSSDYMKAGSFILLSSMTFFLDSDVRPLVQNNRTAVLDVLERVGYVYGAPEFAGPALVALYFTGVLTNDDWLRQSGLMLGEVLLTVGAVQVPLRFLTGRARPDAEKGSSSFKFLGGTDQKRDSFFSGHAAIAFGFSTVLAHQINNPAATIGLYVLATVTPLARLYRDRHWFSDAVIGAGIGLYIGHTIVSWHEDQSLLGVSVFPTPHGATVFIRF